MNSAVQLMIAEGIKTAADHLSLKDCLDDVKKYTDLDDSIFFEVFIY